MSFRARSLALLCAISWAAPALAEEPATAVTGSGEDILRPSRRFDLRTELSGAHSEAELMFTLRQDHSVQLANDWQLRLRVDAPFKTLRDEEDGQTEWNHLGLSDVLLHAVIVRTVGKDEGFGVGAQLIVPTAGRDELGARLGLEDSPAAS